ncbi:MAG: cytochrome c oxidase subunit I [Chloroflexota bacterium]|jgi:cytochrome c oxidase subunit 1|nr:cytochrome c oxidase subunit I [Chloroflexota bacterium]
MASISIPLEKRRSALVEWLTTVDHKKIGIVYMGLAFTFFIFSGLLALAIRTQLAAPGMTVISQEFYNQAFTMHGTGMIFLFTIPFLVGGFGNYFMPIQIGARDMAFPKMNAFSLWLFVFAGFVMEFGFMLSMVANATGWGNLGLGSAASWNAYVPYSTRAFSPQAGMDIWLIGITLNGISGTLGAVNILVTVYSLRAPGMSVWRLPMFTWTLITTAVMILLATPVLTAGLMMLTTDRNFNTQFFTTADPRMWQHVFWFYSHPAVYIMVLPAMGVISEILPVFSRKPIFGLKALMVSTALIALLGFTTWAHHMFVSGVNPLIQRFFMFTTMLIAVPTGVKIFNWIFTMWGGSLNMKTPLMMSIGFISTFTIGGITGVFLGMIPVDQQLHNSYYVVSHFHYVLFGGSVFGIFGGLYYWLPKIYGRMLSDKIGKVQFWLMLFGFNLTFFPQYILGLLGMPRRIATYLPDRGWDIPNLLSSIGAFTIAFSVLLFIINFVIYIVGRKGEVAGDDPWEGNTLEWMTQSPPPEYNFKTIPVVHSERPLWDIRHANDNTNAHGKH